MALAGWHYRLALCGAGAGLLALTAPALATDLIPASETRWDGFYVGGQLGGAWSDTDWRYDNHNWFNTIGPALVGTDFDIDASGILGGGQAGFNYQAGSWVIGIEGSVAGADLDESRKAPSSRPPTLTLPRSIGWPPRPGVSAMHKISGSLTSRAAGRAPTSSSPCWTLGHRCAPTRATGPTAGSLAAAPNMPFAKASRSASSTTMPISTETTGNQLPDLSSGVGGGVPVVDGDIKVQSVTARLNYRFGG
jgi:opacity protein-like surface antigen